MVGVDGGEMDWGGHATNAEKAEHRDPGQLRQEGLTDSAEANGEGRADLGYRRRTGAPYSILGVK